MHYSYVERTLRRRRTIVGRHSRRIISLVTTLREQLREQRYGWVGCLTGYLAPACRILRKVHMNIDITPNAEQLLAKRGGVMTIDFISAVG